jgi:fibronectin-binding autotransporter adhesin
MNYRLLLAPLLLFGLPAAQALATASNGTWTQIIGGAESWATMGNWLSGIVAGAAGAGTTDTGTATFSATNIALTTGITLDQTRNLQNITFSSGSASGYTINSGSTFDLTSGGTIQTTANDLGVDTINSALVLEGANGTYSFISGSTTTAVTLNFGGQISGGAAGGTTLMLGGANTGNNTISGNIVNGLATAVNLDVSSGRWVLSGNNGFTGEVSILGGTLTLGSAGALGNANTVFNANGATLDLGGQTIGTYPLIIVGAGVGGNGALINSSANPASYAGTVSLNGPTTIGGSGQITLSGSVNGFTNTITKIGNNTLILSGATNNGPDVSGLGVVVNAGTVVLAKTGSGSPNDVHAIGQSGLTINGGIAQLGGTGGDQIFDGASVSVASGTFDAAGQSETFFGLSLAGTGIAGNGALLNSASGASVITPTGGTTLTADTAIGVLQGSGSLTLNGPIGGGFGITKVGPGTFTISGNNTYTGKTTIAAGSLIMSGGSLASDVLNQANFVFDGGAVGGRLTNQGTAAFNANFIAGNGMENDGTATATAGVTLIFNGAGMDNEGTLTATGGTINFSGAANVNRGNLSAASLNLAGATLANQGSLALAGSTIFGASGSLINGIGGSISGTGVISTAFINSGGLVTVGSGTLNITQPFTNSSVIQLTSFTANLVGGAIINNRTVNGNGNISNAITNNGTIAPLGGNLYLSGALSNPAAGLIRASAGNEVLVTQGLPTNAGIINLIGGTFDNDGFALNNTGQISGFGNFATGGAGLDNNGSITFSGGLTTVNGPVTNENGETITVEYNPAILTGLVTNTGSGTFNVISTTVTFAGGSSGNVPGAFANAAGAAFGESGSGVIEVDGPPSLGNSSSIAVGPSSILRFKATSGMAAIGTAVTATIASGGTLELAGTVSALSSGPNRVSITNNSSSAGILVSGTNQQVGNIDGSGTTQVNAGSDLTANHIVQSALVISGTAGSHGLMTIDASDALGNPLDQPSGFALADSLTPSGPLGAGETSSASVSSVGEGVDEAALSLGNSALSSNSSPVPEPSTLLLALLAVLGAVSTHFVRHFQRYQTV